ncbi:branched-chain amino acid ABC transporter permease [Bradyrhizobium sp. U87765 SZCCT0131]|uniref:branched-chain amino acid ABC transporter permease n=1 Tax=unclassified Bradyrhizobium TaxID=2631580 RepID=UPI001BACEA72|nr:branched-chain amino acid ABC transporter permease [Bradyrhizobium sp. U87765 SZCCT0131]MBR1264450.1 branched-chain amino acid ABC transporter permease [Bradyrhizobium sp. U87765 SZCCT0134]MBR1304643.1 branched-chain amino acid ABC transporter permease [Bradyrhizobium sp. U87765 SZCCT0110]MBR1322500.1 branched-chain amino acid ABC transporter permease [Bradyrhizobium sp. U87765 SZCCT0109]MBR1346572.1 branched-chain amino acid ABC transporter permease [Bradyrhizobium sp. U87765 SZCCT0048]
MYYLDLTLNGLIFGSMYALMAVGLTLVYGLLRILHIAHASVYALGAFVTVIVANATGSIALGIFAAMLVSALMGGAIYRLLYQPLLAHPPYVAMVASMGLLVFMEDAFRILFGEQGLTFRSNPWPMQVFDVFGLTINAVQIAMLVVSTLCLVALGLFTTRTRIGVAWRATVSNPTIATSFGVDAIKVRYLNFFIGSALAGLAGALIALLNNFVEPSMGFVVSYKALAIIVLGGLGSIRGTLIAAFALGLIESYGTIALRAYLDRDALAFLFLIVILMLRPQGLTGARTA